MLQVQSLLASHKHQLLAAAAAAVVAAVLVAVVLLYQLVHITERSMQPMQQHLSPSLASLPTTRGTNNSQITETSATNTCSTNVTER